MKLLINILFLISLSSCNNSSFFKINGGNFDQDVYVLITEDTATALSFIKNVYPSATAADLDSRGTTFPSMDGLPVIIWLPNTYDASVVNHELLHATIDIMNWANIPLTPETEEVFTYELQYLSKQFYEHLK